MRGGRSMIKPISFSGSSASDEASLLELHLQKQLEEDVARIFDESIYSDLEVACGKFKILTHSCILKARTLKFYHKLETILHANVGRKILDEIYSFISDAYTECDIQHQETEIIAYLDDNLITLKTNENKTLHTIENIEEIDVFLTPKCVSPYEEKKHGKTISSSPSTELTKEYYALVPIDGNSLEKELIEQDVISNAFHYIIKTQRDDANEVKSSQRCKPTSLSLSSSHSPKTDEHSNNCDSNENNANTVTSQELKNHKYFISSSLCERLPDRVLLDSAYSPDSLVTDDLSSSSDYLSAAYACSPGILSSTACLPQLNVGDSVTKMENIFTSSDSGLENTAMVESIDSHKDVTLTDISLTESTLHDLAVDDASNSHESSLQAEKKHVYKFKQAAGSSQVSLEKDYEDINTNKTLKKEMSGKSSKAEKQRQNEEIVIMESSSLSSETGSWESVFPPKLPAKDICEKFINCERQNTIDGNLQSAKPINSGETHVTMDINHKSAFKSAPCFIDAASLVDEENDIISSHINQTLDNIALEILPAPSQPVPCSTAKLDISPSDWSENNDNDSLEQNGKDPDSIQKDLSPTIFEMTPITEDSLCTNAFENPAPSTVTESNKNMEVLEQTATTNRTCLQESFVLKSVVCQMASSTPNNSIMSLKSSTFKQYESEESESDNTVVGRASNKNMKFQKYDESSPIISGEFTTDGHDMSCNSSTSSAWIVDMSNNPHSEKINSDGSTLNSTVCTNKPTDKISNILKNDQKSTSLENCSKSRASVDSDSSERSSHKFYIDLSSMPDPLPSEKNGESESLNEKKNIFSMFIDIGENSIVKEMPPRLSSSLNTKKNNDYKKCTTTTVSVTNDSIFEKYELLCNDPNISISEIISIPDKKVKVTTDTKDINDSSKKNKSTRTFSSDKTTSRTVATVIQEEPIVDKQSCNDLFVKLSDLDKPAHKATTSVVINEEKILDSRMTRSIPDNSWGEQNHSCTSRSIEVISSFHSENALSLNRLFPHLKNEFSRSMPGSLSSRTRSPLRLGNSTSPGDIDEQASDVSEMSSVQSSICRSGIENSTNEESSQTSSIIINCQSRLGQDLLRMFLEEIAPDVIVEVSGRRIKAHKCILSSRCQYFAGILSGGWVESAGNVISLPPFSYNVVHFALCHIYSGLSTIPDTISIVELATIADMLSLEGLKEAIMFTLKSKYCHHFHKPCGLCIAGVLECFPLSSVYGLDDLYHKCLKWITRYFTKVWPTKAFATLPTELLDKCFQQHIVNLTTDNLVVTVYGCGATVSSLNNSRWAESVARMCRRLVNAAAHYAAPRLVAVLQSVGSTPAPPLTPSPSPSPAARQALDDCVAAAIEWAPPDEACRAYAYLSALLVEIWSERYTKPDLIADGNAKVKTPSIDNPLYTRAGSWRLQCESALVRTAPRVVGIRAFKDLPPDLRKRLRELGCIMYGAQALPVAVTPQRPNDRKSRSAYHSEPNKMKTALTSRSLDIDHVRASFVPYASKPTAPIGSVDVIKSNNDLSDFRKCARLNPPRVRTTKAQEERAKFNKIKNNQPQDRPKKTTARAITFENTKPRYLEPRTNKENDKRSAMNKPLIAKMVSSSESSRNSSPIQARNLRVCRTKARPDDNAKAQTMSQDSLATSSRPRTAEPSTDSLSESQTSNKYATYTKTKHTKGSVESIRSTKCHSVHNTQPASNNNKLKTKIPVYLNQSASSHKRMGRPATNASSASGEASVMTPFRNKIQERKVPGSLMNATKSSSAKMVPKIVKDAQSSKYTSKQKGTTKLTKQQVVEPEMSANIPIMERSGTFLKDEPTFGDKTTNIDIDQ